MSGYVRESIVVSQAKSKDAPVSFIHDMVPIQHVRHEVFSFFNCCVADEGLGILSIYIKVLFNVAEPHLACLWNSVLFFWQDADAAFIGRCALRWAALCVEEAGGAPGSRFTAPPRPWQAAAQPLDVSVQVIRAGKTLEAVHTLVRTDACVYPHVVF